MFQISELNIKGKGNVLLIWKFKCVLKIRIVLYIFCLLIMKEIPSLFP